MQAFVKYGNKPFEAELRSFPMPEPGENEVLVAVSGCGVCGSDLHAYEAAKGYEWVSPPVTLGHEFGGIVVAVGSSVSDFREGDKVVVIGIQGCLVCADCRRGNTNLCRDRKVIGLNMDGGMASHAVVNARHLIPVPEKVDISQIALVEPASVAMQALSKVRILPGDRVVVSGPGPIGLLCCMLATLHGAKVVLIGAEDDVAVRLAFAEKQGITTVNATRDPELIGIATAFEGAAPDVWIEAAGVPSAFLSGVECLRQGGSLIVVGMYSQPVHWQPTLAVRRSLSFFFSYASVDDDYRRVMQLMAGGLLDLSPLMSVYPIPEVKTAFEAAMKRQVIKPVLVP